VSSVTRRSEADVLLAQQRFAVAVIDLCLPDGGGDEVARQLRAISPATRIVMTSAYAQTSPQLQAAATLGDAFIAKPFKNADLISAVAARPIPTAAGC
jgi:CheY-like chemotaxis protein